MRLGFGLALTALALLSACADDKAARLAAANLAEWGCAPVEGIKAINGDTPPAWVLVGEFVETSEAPAAVAEIACNLATSGGTLFVGVSEYLGGRTDAETRMHQRLGQLVAKGAPIVVAAIGEGHRHTVHQKSRAEKAWAEAIAGQVSAAHASRALLLVSRADAIAEPIASTGDRFAGYSPMPVFLRGDVVSLEIAANPVRGAAGPVIRIHPEMRDGFHGQVALTSLTRPAVAVMMPDRDGRSRAEASGDLFALDRSEDWRPPVLPPVFDRLAPERGAETVGPRIFALPPDPAEDPALLEKLLDGLPRFEVEEPAAQPR